MDRSKLLPSDTLCGALQGAADGPNHRELQTLYLSPNVARSPIRAERNDFQTRCTICTGASTGVVARRSFGRRQGKLPIAVLPPALPIPQHESSLPRITTAMISFCRLVQNPVVMC
jgi:hypothetical protein